MKKYCSILAFLLLIASTVAAQEKVDSTAKLEHQIVAGFNIGATAPISLPVEILGIEGFWPQFTPQLGYNITYRFKDGKWGVGAGILLDYKGMGTKVKVKSIHTIVNLEDGGEITVFEGNFTGYNKTEVKNSYITIPLYASLKAFDKWKFRLGGYISYLFSSEFSGEVSDGYIRKGSPTGEKIEIENSEFNFGKEVRPYDVGLLCGTEYSIKRFGIFANLTWGMVSIFPSSFTGITYKMYNIYGTIGLTYTL